MAVFAKIARADFLLGIILAIVLLHILHYHKRLSIISSLFISFLLFYVYFTYTNIEGPVKDERVQQLTFRILETPFINGDRLETKIKTNNGEKLLLSYWIPLESEKQKLINEINIGLVCQLDGDLYSPKKPRNRHAFDYAKYLKTEKISYIFSPEQFSHSHCVQAKLSLYERLLKIRNNSIQSIEKFFPDEVEVFITALLFGEKRMMDRDIQEAYQRLGLSHLLAISGLHVGIITTFFYFIFLRIGITKERTRTILLVILPFYAMIAGGAPSVLRAVMMTWLVLFFLKWRKIVHPLDAIGLTFIILLVYNPFFLDHVGFQLSFTVATALLLSKQIFARETQWFKSSLLVSLISQLISFPLLIYHFFEFHLLSFIINIVYVPIYSIVLLPMSLVSFIIIEFIPKIANLFVVPLSFLFNLMNKIAQSIAKYEIFTITVGRPEKLILVIFFISMIIVFILMEQKNWWRNKTLYFLVLFPFLLQKLFVTYSPIGEVAFIDVGQGDSIFIQLPFGQGNYLIDTGGVIDMPMEEWQVRTNRFDPGKNIVVPFIKSKGISKIDKLILTHGDMDHIGSTTSIMENLNVKELVVGKTINKKAMELEIISEAKKRGIKITEVYEGAKWEKGKGNFFVLAPQRFAQASNDASIVIYGNFGGKKWLFTGDLEKSGEEQLVVNYFELPVDVLKVGHHGSLTSTSSFFLDHIDPLVAVISVGEKNRYGHPSKRVIDDLQKRRILVYRTDEHGAVYYRFFLTKGYFTTVFPNKK
ncbi:DNA internalization-related competence protein ComEC/Rec2 [Bacillus kwashiorkori]|uniref:DNA internalization-related competence protein ComEC/Rec2 n=1 Tax=Bacillus kwashiorkori TaxID=1522318 RepID=UPI000B143D4E|nr:DNA internalization-related competence protein ComEC/Rec2 [Bacillus kwashiorkori]